MDVFSAFTPDNLKFLLEGFGVTLKVAFISIAFSFILGTLIGTLRYARIPAVSQLMFLWVELIRNLPLILIIFFLRNLLFRASESG